MTLKYESEILFDLMKRDGDTTPSDVLPYESELKEKYLEQVEGAYPKLMDYRPEWLYYNLYSHLPANFPVESLSNVTNATAQNVVPYAYGTASLKGQTLVNLLDFSQWGKQEKITFIADGTAKRMDLGRNLPIKLNTKYLTIIPVYENTINNKFTIGGWGYFSDQPTIKNEDGTGIIKIIKTTKDSFSDTLFYLELWKENTSGKITFGKPMFIEYQEGMENWDISSFEGMKSVQMPGLTTSNEAGTKTNILTVNEDIELRGIGSVQDELNLLTGELTQRIGEVVLDGSEKWFGTSKNYRVEIPNVKGYKDLKWGQKSAISNLYPPFEGTETDSYIISEWDGNQIRIHDINNTIEELKAKLAKNPLHVIFILNEESVKTVELTVTDQEGNSVSIIRPLEGTMHLMTEGEPIKPLFSGEIPVEATTQNLMSFVNMKGEE